ncbi:MAG: DnaD domain protein [Eubacterium sp.]
MQYQVIPVGDLWQGGMFCVPNLVVRQYIKLASEYQLKALMIVLSNNGNGNPKDVAKILGCTESDACDFLDFWVEEGLLSCDRVTAAPTVTAPDPAKPPKEEPRKPTVESMPIPTLTPKDIVTMCREDSMLTDTLRSAQEVLGKTLSHAQQEMIINMITYYGLPGDVVLTILQYYVNEKKSGRVLGTAYVTAMAKDWSEQGITTLDAADEKLRELELSDKLWTEIIAMAGMHYRNPTAKQRVMIRNWREDFSMEMIGIACDAMNENAAKPSLKYVDGILKKWKKQGIKTPADVENDNAQHKQRKENSDSHHSDIDTTYDLDEIERRAMFDDNNDI